MTLQRHHNNKVDFNSLYLYRDFLKQHTGLKITQKQYTLIIKTLFELAMHKIIHEAYRFFFPGLGLFYLVRKKIQIKKDTDGNVKLYASINWPATKKLIKKTEDPSKRVYYMNDHSDGHVYQIIWDKKNINFVNKFFYIFVVNKKHKQSLQKAIVTSDKYLDAWYQ